MSASAILSPATAPPALTGRDASADAPGSSGDFAAILATEANDTPADATAAPDVSVPELNAGEISPIWLQSPTTVLVIPIVADPAIVADTPAPGTADEGRPAASAFADESAPSPFGTLAYAPLSPAQDAPDTVAAKSGQAPETAVPVNSETSDADVTSGVETARSGPGATVADALATGTRSPAAEAALASLRAVPGAAALQQATITQRKTGSTATGNGALDAATGNTGSAFPGLSDAVSAAHAVKDPKVSGADLVVEALPAIVDPSSSTAEGEAGVVTGTASASSGSSAGSTTTTDTSLSSLSRATIETTATLAAQITSRLAGRSTRFELGLTPEGLGRVDVTLDIDADGQLSARLAFDNPLAATELRGRADELRRQLEDAGFTLARDALDFSSRDNPSGGGPDRRQQRAMAYADRHAARTDLADAPPGWSIPPSRLTPLGVDVKV